MPQPFNNAVITDGGAALLAMAQAGKTKIQFTRMATGNGVYSEEEKTLAALQAATGLKSEKNSYALSNIDVVSGHSVKLTALITNQDPATSGALIDEGYYINEIGIFARPDGGGDEVLYSIVVTAGNNGDFMPPYNGFHPAQIIQDYYVTVDNSADVIIHVGDGAVALAADLQKLAVRVEDESAENDTRFRQIFGMIDEMCRVGSPEDIDRIIRGTYEDDGYNGGFLEAGTAQDIDDIINGVFVETEDTESPGYGEVTEDEIAKIVNNAFR